MNLDRIRLKKDGAERPLDCRRRLRKQYQTTRPVMAEKATKPHTFFHPKNRRRQKKKKGCVKGVDE